MQESDLINAFLCLLMDKSTQYQLKHYLHLRFQTRSVIRFLATFWPYYCSPDSLFFLRLKKTFSVIGDQTVTTPIKVAFEAVP